MQTPITKRPSNLWIVLVMIVLYVGALAAKPDIVASYPAWMSLIAGAGFATGALWTHLDHPSRRAHIASYSLLAVNGVLQFFAHSLPSDSSSGMLLYRLAVVFTFSGAILLLLANAKLRSEPK